MQDFECELDRIEFEIAVEQIKKWIEGDSSHNELTGDCCPDMSCCGYPKAPVEERKAFLRLFKRQDGSHMEMLQGYAIKTGIVPKEHLAYMFAGIVRH